MLLPHKHQGRNIGTQSELSGGRFLQVHHSENSTAVQAGHKTSKASFQRVTCALLHLLSLPVLVNSALSQWYNSIHAVVEASLDMRNVCASMAELSRQSHIRDVTTVSLCSALLIALVLVTRV